jgi:nicotinamide-nucleotide amidase
MTSDLAARAIGVLERHGLTVATAESLTGGLVAAALTTVPGSSAVFRGGIVAYAPDLKSALLGVPAALLDAVGTIHPDVARAMAVGARRSLRAAVGVATTGVAGPDAAEGHPVGTVHIAVSTPTGTAHRALALPGDRDQVRGETVRQALELLLGLVGGDA